MCYRPEPTQEGTTPMSAAPAALASVLYERRENVAIVTLNRPGRMNTLGGSIKPELAPAFFEYARADERVRAVLITGSGERAFCAGADIKERADQQTTGSDYFVAQKATHELLRNIEEFEKPVLAAINGVALGGGLEVALCCDIRLACDSARFGLPEVKLGVIPAAGGTQRLPRLIGQARAKELILTADLIDADTALRYGIVSRVPPHPQIIPSPTTISPNITQHTPPPTARRWRTDSPSAPSPATCRPPSTRAWNTSAMRPRWSSTAQTARRACGPSSKSASRCSPGAERRPCFFQRTSRQTSMKLGLEGQVALVTGGGQGVGRQICIELATEGARVIVNDLFAQRAEAVAKEITAAGGQALAAPADITHSQQVQAMVARGRVHFDAPVTVLVNNAGIIPEHPQKGGRTPAFLDMPTADWAKIVDLNLYGTMNCCHSVLPGMVERNGGRIINIISEAGRIGEANMAVYSGAKAAMAGFGSAFAREQGRY